jgi:outer membrane protein assembly factor BamA
MLPLARLTWAADNLPQPDVSDLQEAQQSPPGLGLSRWINPGTAPFIPVPVIGVDPNSGTTLGIMPTFVHTNDQEEISRIIAPDFVHNPNFGYGAHGRIFDYPSDNEQWSMVAGIQQRVERLFDAEYQNELLRQQLWSFSASLIFNRDGTPRLFGIGNQTVKRDETNYTKEQELAQLQIGLNLSHAWQILYTVRPQRVRVSPGALSGVASIETRFADAPGIGTNTILLNRVSAVYDTRDNLVVPRAGTQWVLYGGLASRHGLVNDSTYSEAGLDGRSFWTLNPSTVLAAHVALRYLPSATDVPFWALSGLGGDRDEVGGDQAMRGFGAGRFYDRNSFASSVELRHTLFSFNAATTHVDVEATPFLDVGRVFEKTGTFPLSHLHQVAGIGIRGVARPFIVGYVDFGYGGEGLAAFTGINYPF